MSRKLQGRLYEIYSRGSKWSFALNRRITLFGWLMIAIFPVMCFVTMRYPRDTLFQLLAVGGAVIAISLVSLFFRRVRLSVEREVPAYGTVGECVHYEVRVSNLGRLSASNYFLCDQAPDPTPSKELFLNSTEPGEELRNGFDQKFVAYRWMWMMRRRLLLKAKDYLGIPLEAGSSGKTTLAFTPIRRGVIVLDQLHALLPDPLGLFQRLIKVRQEADTMTILPKRYAFDGMLFEGESRNQLGGDAASSVAGQSGEFVSLREYRAGDPLKHMHWPSWGKSGKPVIKVYEDLFFPRYGLVLDTAVKAEQEDVFETAISLAATFACSVDTQQSLLDLMFVQQGAKIHSVGKNVDKVDSMLEVLAGLDMEDQPDWTALSGMVLNHADDLTTCIVVLCEWDSERQEFLQRLAASGVHLCVLLVVDRDSNQPASADGYFLLQVRVGKEQAALAELSSL